MDSQKKFELDPFPVEKEFRVHAIRERLYQLPREELEEFLVEALFTMTKLAHQVTQLRDHVEFLEGKTD